MMELEQRLAVLRFRQTAQRAELDNLDNQRRLIVEKMSMYVDMLKITAIEIMRTERAINVSRNGQNVA